MYDLSLLPVYLRVSAQAMIESSKNENACTNLSKCGIFAALTIDGMSDIGAKHIMPITINDIIVGM